MVTCDCGEMVDPNESTWCECGLRVEDFRSMQEV